MVGWIELFFYHNLVVNDFVMKLRIHSFVVMGLFCLYGEVLLPGPRSSPT